MIVYTLNPLMDSCWSEFLARRPDATIFHTSEWLRALQRTYGYEPIVFTTSKGGELSNGVVFCHVRSWLTGNRLVSLPFSDHCQPLAAGDDLNAILRLLRHRRRSESLKYIELRPYSDTRVFEDHSDFGIGQAFSFHTIDLHPALETIFRRFHDSCVRRKIKRAEREKLTLESGRSKDLLDKFRHLMLLTRRRHMLPPQPAEWFSNLVECLGDKLTIHVISKDGAPAASILTLTYKKTLMYKYGCSDSRFHNLGGMPLLFWKAIQQGKPAGMEQFDLGRSAPADPGLVAFKGHLGAVASELKYYRTPTPSGQRESSQPAMQWVRQALACLPEPVLVGAGNLLYKHLG
jgi:CelD/BcsL family acetyltransferase involved in cellulose biosynthesis